MLRSQLARFGTLISENWVMESANPQINGTITCHICISIGKLERHFFRDFIIETLLNQTDKDDTYYCNQI